MQGKDFYSFIEITKMKWILIILFLITGYVSFGQSDGNDSSRYVKPKGMYGSRPTRLWADSVLIIPNDTTFSKDGVARIGTVVYVGNGEYWTAVAGTGTVIINSPTIDSITFTETSICKWIGGTSTCADQSLYFTDSRNSADGTRTIYYNIRGDSIATRDNVHTDGYEGNGFYFGDTLTTAKVFNVTPWIGTQSIFRSGARINRSGNVIINSLDDYTGEAITFSKVTTWYDGTSMDDTKLDSVIYRKRGDEYFKRNLVNGQANVKQWGATGDGTTNDNAAITAAIAYCKLTGTTLYFPDGNYLVTTTVFADAGSQGRGLSIIGQSRDKTRFIYTPSGKYTPLFNFWHTALTLENFQVYNNAGTKNGIAFKFGDSTTNHDCSRMIIRNVGVASLARGFDFQRAYIIDAYSVATYGCDTAIFACVNGLNLYGLVSELNNYGIVIDANNSGYGYGVGMYSPLMESDSVSIKIGRTKGTTIIMEPYFEGNFKSDILAGTASTDDAQGLYIRGGTYGARDSIVLDRVRSADVKISTKGYSPIKITGNCLDCVVGIPNATFDVNNNTNGVVISAVDSTYNTAEFPIFRSNLSDVTLPSSPTTDSVILFSSGNKKVVLNMTLGTMVRDTINKVRGSQSAMFIPTQGITPIGGNVNYSDIPSIDIKVSPSMFTQRYGCIKLKVYIVNASTVGLESRAQMANIFGGIVHTSYYTARMFNSHVVTTGTPNNSYLGKWEWIYIPVDTLLAYNIAAASIGGTAAGRRLDFIEFRVTSNYFYNGTGGAVPSDSANRIYINEIEIYNGKFPGGNFVESKDIFNPARLNVSELTIRDSAIATSNYNNLVVDRTTRKTKEISASNNQPVITWGSGLTYTGTTATNNLTTGVTGNGHAYGSTTSGNYLYLNGNTSGDGRIVFGDAGTSYYDESTNFLRGLTSILANSLATNTGQLTITHRQDLPIGIRFAANGTTVLTSGTLKVMSLEDNFTPPSGTATRDFMYYSGTINQSAGGTGITSFAHIVPTLTSPADWRGIFDETTTGHFIYQKNTGVLNSFFGQLGFGKLASTTSYASFAASTASKSSANFPTGTAPSSPVDGDMWVASNILNVRLNGVTYPLANQLNGSSFTGGSTYAGTSGQTYTFPTTTATIARTDAAQTFTGNQTFGAILLGGNFITTGGQMNILHRQDIAAGIVFSSNGNTVLTSGNRNTFQISDNISPTSGTLTYNMLQMVPTINQTGGANGITRGWYINPTLTAAADWRSIQWDNATGYGLYGAGTAPNYFAGKVGIGQTTATAVLHLKAGTATANTAPLKFTSGTNLTTAEDGAVEYNGTDLQLDITTNRYILAKTLQASATLDFASTSAQSSTDLTITVTGAAVNDEVSVGAPNGSVLSNSAYTAWISATNTATVRFNNYSTGAQDPASGTFRVSVIKH